MSLDGWLALVAILVGVYALLRPEHRHSFWMFFPVWLAGAALGMSLLLIVVPIGWEPYGYETPGVWLFWSRVLSIVVPSAALIGSRAWFTRRRLTPRNAAALPQLLSTCVRENCFDEVEEIIRRNLDQAALLAGPATELLFEPAIVGRMLDSRSLVHLELIADTDYLDNLSDRWLPVDRVIRELLVSGYSPLRDRVAREYGTSDDAGVTNSATDALLKRTLLNAEWFAAVGAAYPLLRFSEERLFSGSLDTTYDQPNHMYVTSQGRSLRRECPIFIAVKTHVLAVRAAIEAQVTRDYYLDNLYHVFRLILDRSRPDGSGDCTLEPFRTPYEYLLYGIASDFKDLSSEAASAGLATGDQQSRLSSIPRQLAHSWAWCVCAAAQDSGHITDGLRTGIIKDYLNFTLCLKHAPCDGAGPAVCGTVQFDQDAWYDLFVDRLVNAFKYFPGPPRDVLLSALAALDTGKSYVWNGRDQLHQDLTTGLGGNRRDCGR